jgi:mannose-6-phosphate isomerase-like protein (cupin superfamily)
MEKRQSISRLAGAQSFKTAAAGHRHHAIWSVTGSSRMPSDSTKRREVINFARKFALFSEQWQPKVIAELNDYQFKIVRIAGDFVWHDHPETDEAFIVLDGELRIDLRDRSVVLGPGEMFVVPKGTEHKPFAEKEVKMLLIEPRGTLNTGHEGGERTAENDVWI